MALKLEGQQQEHTHNGISQPISLFEEHNNGKLIYCLVSSLCQLSYTKLVSAIDFTHAIIIFGNKRVPD